MLIASIFNVLFYFLIVADLGPRDLSQRLGNRRGIELGGFSGPDDHSGSISGYF